MLTANTLFPRPRRQPRALPLVAILAAIVGSLLLASPTLAATNTFSGSQFGGGETAEGSFYPAALAFDGAGDVFVSDGEHARVDEFGAGGAGAPLREFGPGTAAEDLYSEGIAVNGSGDLFVANEESDAVDEFEPGGKLLREITGGETSAGSFLPIGIALGASGDLYVGDYDGDVVDVFAPAAYEAASTGAPMLEIAVSAPTHVAVSATSGDIYVSGEEGGGSVLHEFEPDGTPIAFSGAGTPQEEEGGSFAPGAVAVAPSGEVYVADDANQVVDRYGEGGEYLSQFNGGETPQKAFSYIDALAVNAEGEVYVADAGNLVIDIYSAPQTRPTRNFYANSQFGGGETAEGSFYPAALAFDGAGDVFVSDGEHARVDEFGAGGAGAPLREFGPGTAAEDLYSEGIAVNGSGDLFVANEESDAVDEFEPGGKLLREITGGETSAGSFLPIGIALGASGDLYVGDYDGDVVDVFAPAAYEAASTGAPMLEIAVSAPTHVAVSATSGDIYVSGEEGGGSVLHEFEPDGTPIAFSGAGTPQEEEGGSFAPGAVAVAPSGEVYVADDANQVVDRYGEGGEYLSQFNGGETPQKAFSYIDALAVNAEGEVYVADAGNLVIDIYSAPQEVASKAQWVTEAATDVAPTSATLHGTVDPEGAPVTTCEFEYGTSGALEHTAACEQDEVEIGSGTGAVPVSAEVSDLEPGTQYHFRVGGEGAQGEGHSGEESFTTGAKPPSATIEPVTDIDGHCATFNGEVDPEGAATTYRFEDSTNGSAWTDFERASAGEETSAVGVSQDACGLSGSTTYHVRLFAENVGGHVISSGEETFATPASAPQIGEVGASVRGDNEATLYATIYPEKQATTYRFEYGTTSAYGAIAPTGEGAAGTAPTQVSQTITGLAPGTTYHLRVVATNATNVTYGAGRTFTTPVVSGAGGSASPGHCANEALRAESDVDPQTDVPYSTQLPDCRAYELVTPSFKDGALFGVNSNSKITEISDSGSPLFAVSASLLGVPGGDPALRHANYELTRGGDSWNLASATPPASQLPFAALLGGDIWAAATPSQSLEADDLYLRETDGAFVAVGPIAPPSLTAGPPRGDTVGEPREEATVHLAGVSENSSHVLFEISETNSADAEDDGFHWPGDHTQAGLSTYEYVGTGHTGEGGDVPALVGVDNQGAQISQCGTALGAVTEGDPRDNEHNAVSAAGTTVFFNAEAGGCGSGATGPSTNQLYARIGSPGEAQTTIDVAGSSGCANSTSCNVTSPVVYQGAANDGSKVFFTATQSGLVSGDDDATNNIYECELSGDEGTTPAPAGLVNACPDLKAVTASATGAGANVQSVVAVSEEGSRVYFTAKGVLTGGEENDNHESAVEGQDNLYVWEALGKGEPEGRTAFIGILPDESPNEAQATPDGQYLVFTTTADLTSDDTSTAAQAFRYDALNRELIRISVGQEGFKDDGNTSSEPASLAGLVEEAGTVELGVTVSEDGAYVVFQSNDALTSRVDGGLDNVYEWHDGEVALISAGADANPRPGAIGLIGTDASGADIFFATTDRLVGQDADEDVDVYDARIEGGFPSPKPAPSCTGEECQGESGSALGQLGSGSSGPPAVGNLRSPGLKLLGEEARRVAAKVTVLHRAVHHFDAFVTVKVSGAGKLVVDGRGVSAVTKKAGKARQIRVKMRLNRHFRKLLGEHRRKEIAVKLHLIFKAAGGKAARQSIHVRFTSKVKQHLAKHVK